jgi:superfamily II DNA or RNA helicase
MSEEISTYLGPKGYTIKKEFLDIEELNLIKKELTVRAYVPKSSLAKPTPFPIYRESRKKIYIPKFYGLENYGEPEAIITPEGKNINVKFKGSLRDYQKPVVNKWLKAARKKGCGLIEADCGAGKTCMAIWLISQLQKKALIIVHKEFLLNQWKERIEQFMPDAKIGRIQGPVIDIEGKDIVIGMLQSLSMKDYEQSMFLDFGFTIIDECFPYKQFIHTDLGPIRIGTLYEKWKNGETLPMILSFNKETKTFEYKRMTHAWRKERKDLIKIKLSKKVINCTPEHKILTTKGYIKANELNEGDLVISKYDNRHIDNIISPALNDDQLQLIYGSYLGDGYIDITKKNRYRLRIVHCEKQKEYCTWKAHMFNISKLNYCEKNGYSQKPAYNFQTKIFDLEEDIPKNTKIVPDWILDKLDAKGIAVWYMDDGSINKRQLKNGDISNFISIHSNNFDYETQEKFVKKFNEYGINPTIHKTKNLYYYLIFNKENTRKLLDLISPYIHESMQYKIDNRKNKYIWNNKFLDYGLLKVTSKSYFENKGANRCKKPYVYDIEVEDNHNFILATKTKKYYVDGPVVSNCHHISAEVFSKVLFKAVTKYMLGLSATMDRKDGLTKVFKMFLGNVEAKWKRKSEDNVVVKAIEYRNDDFEYEKELTNYRGQTDYVKMISKICEFSFRTEFILKVAEDTWKKTKKQIMIIGHRKKQLIYIHDAIKHRGFATVGYYIGGMKEKDLKISEEKEIVIATYTMAEEALDIKSLATIIMSTPKKDVRQAVGRIMRSGGDKLVIDIIDQHQIFKRHWSSRRAWYNKQKYKILYTTNEGYKNKDWEEITKTKKSKSKKNISNPTVFIDTPCFGKSQID